MDSPIYVEAGHDMGLRLDVAIYFAHILGPKGRQAIRTHCLGQAAKVPEARDLLNFLNDVDLGTAIVMADALGITLDDPKPERSARHE